jgi:CRP-like cAMP-binding protein
MDEKLLRALIPLNELPPHLLQHLVTHAKVLDLPPGSVVFKQGSRDDNTFYLLDGTVELQVDRIPTKEITAGRPTARYPMPQQQPRQMSAVATTPVKVLAVDRRILENLLIAANRPRAAGSQEWLGIVLASELFRRLPPANIHSLLDTMKSVPMAAGTVVIRQGTPGDYFYILQLGQCEVIRTLETGQEVKLSLLGPGAAFGEEALISSTARNASVRMTADGAVGRFTCEDFIRLIQKPVLKILSREEAVEQICAGRAIPVDVRLPAEHAESGVPGSINVPLAEIRAKAPQTLHRHFRYVVCCDTGSRSTVGAFILNELGFHATPVAEGLISGMVEVQPLIEGAALLADSWAAPARPAGLPPGGAPPPPAPSIAPPPIPQPRPIRRHEAGGQPTTFVQTHDDTPLPPEEARRLREQVAFLQEELELERQRFQEYTDQFRRRLQDKVQAIEAQAQERLAQRERLLEERFRKKAEEMRVLLDSRLQQERERLIQELSAAMRRRAEEAQRDKEDKE